MGIGQGDGSFSLFARKLNATAVVSSSTLLVLSVVNQTTATPAQVPYILFMSFPGSPTVQTSPSEQPAPRAFGV